MTRVLALLLAACFAIPASAEERIETIAARGHVRDWMVCGPFPLDVLNTLASGTVPDLEEDPFEPAGGIARLRPKHLQTVPHAEGEALWQEMTTQSPLLDFSSVFGGQREGMAFAAFRAESGRGESVLLDLQSALGARVYLNGFPVRDAIAGPVSATGRDRFMVTLRPGSNLVVIQVPVCSFQSLSGALTVSPRSLAETIIATRPLLPSEPAFSLALAVHPVRAVHGVAVVPSLVSTGTFTDAEQSMQQDAVLTLHNPQTDASPRMILETSLLSGGESVRSEVPSIAPGGNLDLLVHVPPGDASPGVPMTVRMGFTAGERTTNVDVRLVQRARPERGTVYAVALAPHEDRSGEGPDMMLRSIVLANRVPTFGFNLGGVADWWPVWTTWPEHRASLREWAALGHIGVSPVFVGVDERLVPPEILAKNLLYGRLAAERVLSLNATAWIHDRATGFTSQSAQLFAQADLRGLVTGGTLLDVPPLSFLGALHGALMPLRTVQAVAHPRDRTHLRQIAEWQRRALAPHGISDDVVLLGPDSAGQSLWLGMTEGLSRSIPRVEVSGAGAERFFEANPIGNLPRQTRPPNTGRLMTGFEPGALMSDRDAKDQYFRSVTRQNIAERFATVAALMGAEYPDVPLDTAWRRLLYASNPDLLGYARSNRERWRLLSATRDAEVMAGAVLEGALAYIARHANTLASAPVSDAGVRAIMVFNPTLHSRSDLVSVELTFESAAGLTLLNAAGGSVPYTSERLVLRNNRIQEARVTFVAENVPGFGYTTFYAAPTGGVPKLVEGKGNSIENEFYRVTVDPSGGGAITGVFDKIRSVELIDEGRWGDLVALREDTERTRRGRDLWTNGSVSRASSGRATVSISRSESLSRLTAVAAFGGGTVARTYTLASGIPRIDVEIGLDSLDSDGELLAIAYDGFQDYQTPVYGERFGSVVGRAGLRRYDHRTDDGRNLSGTGAQPAWRWAAFGQGDGIYRGDEYVPLGPVTIVHGADTALRGAAEELQSVLMKRGIPAESKSDTTELGNDRREHAAFRIVLGGPGTNRFAARLKPQLSGEDEARVSTDSETAPAILLHDRANLEDGAVPIPTLWIASDVVYRTTAASTAVARSLASNGSYTVPPVSIRDVAGQESRIGAAILFDGTRLVALEPGGPMLMFFERGRGDGDYDTSFSIMPFAGTWRSSGVSRMAAASSEKLIVHPTDLHLGSNAGRLSFLTTNAMNVELTGMGPALDHPAEMTAAESHPKSGFYLRAFETIGQPANARFDALADIHRAEEANLLLRPRSSLEVGAKGFAAVFDPFEIKTVLMQASSRVRVGPPDSLWSRPADTGPVYSRYRAHEMGGGNIGREPVSLVVRADFDEGVVKAAVLVANNLTDAPAYGTVQLEAPAGWTVSPETIEFALDREEFVQEEVLALRGAGVLTPGAIAIETESEGVRYRDTASQADPVFSAGVDRDSGGMIVTVKNRDGIRLEGFVELVGAGDLGVANAWRRPVSIAPFRDRTFRFPGANDNVEVVKIAANGAVEYLEPR